MFQHLKRLSYDVQTALKAQGIQIARSHVHEGLAALLGYRSVAAMKADADVANWESCFALILDVTRANQRLISFGHTGYCSQIIVFEVRSRLAAFIQGARPSQFGSIRHTLRVCETVDDFLGEYEEYAQLAVFESDEASSEMANTNAMFDEVDIEAPIISVGNFHGLQPGAGISVRADAAMSGDQIDEKLWTDNELCFSITSKFEKVGMFGVRHLSDSVS